MLLPAGSIALFVGLAGASSAVRVALPEGERAEPWAGLAESVGFVLGAAPGCPGVEIALVGGDWRVAVCREGGERRAARVPAADSDEARDRALLTAAQLLYGLGAMPAGASEEPVVQRTTAGLVAELRHAPLRVDLSLSEGAVLKGVWVSGGEAEAWIGPSVNPAPVRPPGKPWLSAGGGGQARQDALAVGYAAVGVGWRLPGGATVAARGEVTGTTALTLPQVSGWEATLTDRSLGASLGWWRGRVALHAGGGVTRREVNQAGEWRASVSIPWVEAAAAAPLTRVGAFALGPAAAWRRELRASEVTINGRSLTVLAPAVLTVGVTAWVGDPPSR